MKFKKLLIASFSFIFLLQWCNATAHDIIFCGERIPVDNDFVSQTLMNVIRKQIPNVNMPELRKRSSLYFPWLEKYLQGSGLPEDLKYIAIVESGFQNLTSYAGAGGFWQLMPLTARDAGLNISEGVDDRNDFYKSTTAACALLTSYYMQIRKKYGISSWVLTAAAYNIGISNLFKAMNIQGNNYFSMSLNAETAMYVYKIIAVKELFEYPELYMKDFGYNVFSSVVATQTNSMINLNVDSSAFKTMTVNVDIKDGEHPDTVSSKNQLINVTNQVKISYVAANIMGKYKTFSDGDLITIKLQNDLQVNGLFQRKGNIIKGKGWIIDNRILIDLGYQDHAVTLFNNGKRGIDISELKNDQPVILKVEFAYN